MVGAPQRHWNSWDCCFQPRAWKGKKDARCFCLSLGVDRKPLPPFNRVPTHPHPRPRGLKGGKSTQPPWEPGSKQAIPHWLPECQKLLSAPEEPKLAMELEHLRLVAAGPPLPLQTRLRNGDQSVHENGDPSSIHPFPVWWGKAAAPVLGTVGSGLGGEVCTMSRKLCDLFCWGRGGE